MLNATPEKRDICERKQKQLQSQQTKLQNGARKKLSLPGSEEEDDVTAPIKQKRLSAAKSKQIRRPEKTKSPERSSTSDMEIDVELANSDDSSEEFSSLEEDNEIPTPITAPKLQI